MEWRVAVPASAALTGPTCVYMRRQFAPEVAAEVGVVANGRGW
jgi:hypothetical protein